jgi:hypothetical protein
MVSFLGEPLSIIPVKNNAQPVCAQSESGLGNSFQKMKRIGSVAAC